MIGKALSPFNLRNKWHTKGKNSPGSVNFFPNIPFLYSFFFFFILLATICFHIQEIVCGYLALRRGQRRKKNKMRAIREYPLYQKREKEIYIFLFPFQPEKPFVFSFPFLSFFLAFFFHFCFCSFLVSLVSE
jgi:hypothetical protein